MKRLFVFCMIFAAFLSLQAQKPSLNKAYNFYYDKDFVKAKEAIDACAQDEKFATKAQTWLYKGNIYYFLANDEYSAKQKDEQYRILYPDAPVEAYDAFAKSLEINPNAEAMDMFSAKEAMRQLYPLLLVRGVDQLIAKDFPAAKNTLAKGIASYEMDKPQYPMNGDLYYYYAYALESLGEKNNDNIILYYNKAMEDGSSNPYVYVRLIEAYEKGNDSRKAEDVLAKAKKNLPGNMSIRLAEIDYHYWKGDSVTASSLLHNIPSSSVQNADELVNLANFYIREKEYEEAESLLVKTNKLSPNNFVILYNLGVCTYSLSERLFDQYNKAAISDPNSAQAKDFKTQSDSYMDKSARYFEQARVLEPNDKSLLMTLRAIYARQQSPKYDEIDKLIQSLEK